MWQPVSTLTKKRVRTETKLLLKCSDLLCGDDSTVPVSNSGFKCDKKCCMHVMSWKVTLLLSYMHTLETGKFDICASVQMPCKTVSQTSQSIVFFLLFFSFIPFVLNKLPLQELCLNTTRSDICKCVIERKEISTQADWTQSKFKGAVWFS